MIYEEECLHHLEITDIVPEDAGEYMVKVENTLGKATCTAQLQVIGNSIGYLKIFGFKHTCKFLQ
jgi:hypothetical protein